MTQDEAFEISRKTGKKITHDWFSYNEYMIIRGARVEFEDGVSCYIDEFLQDRTDSSWKTGWRLFDNQLTTNNK